MGKGSFLLLVAESCVQNVAVSSLGLKTSLLVRDLEYKKPAVTGINLLELLCVLSCKTTVEQLFRVENEWIVHILGCFF